MKAHQLQKDLLLSYRFKMYMHEVIEYTLTGNQNKLFYAVALIIVGREGLYFL